MRSNIRQARTPNDVKGTKRSAVEPKSSTAKKSRQREPSPAKECTADHTEEGSDKETKSDLGGRMRSSSVSEGTSSSKTYQYAIDLTDDFRIIITSEMRPASAGNQSISGTSFAVHKGTELLLDYETQHPTDVGFGLRQLRRLFVQSQNMAEGVRQELADVFNEYNFEDEILNDW